MTADRKPPREVRAWASVDDNGRIFVSTICRDREVAEALAWPTDRVIRVRIVPEVADE